MLKIKKVWIIWGFLFVWVLLASGCQDGNTQARLDQVFATLEAQGTQDAVFSTQVSRQGEFLSYLATQSASQFIPTLAPEPTPSGLVTGSVVIEDGRCCVGGTAGDTLEVQVSFDAQSRDGPVTEMRVLQRNVRELSEMREAEWEPFVPQKTYPVHVALNWIGSYISVQYRDAAGNLSPVYVDDISVEGDPSVTASPSSP